MNTSCEQGKGNETILHLYKQHNTKLYERLCHVVVCEGPDTPQCYIRLILIQTNKIIHFNNFNYPSTFSRTNDNETYMKHISISITTYHNTNQVRTIIFRYVVVGPFNSVLTLREYYLCFSYIRYLDLGETCKLKLLNQV